MKHLRLKLKLKYLALLIAAAVLVGNRGFRSLVRNYLEYRRLESHKAELQKQYVDLKKRTDEVKETPAIEQAARVQLGLIKPDETEYRFPPPKESDK